MIARLSSSTLAALTALSIAACSPSLSRVGEPQDTADPTPPARTSTATNSATGAQTEPTTAESQPAKLEPRPAPPGVFFLKQRASISTDSGIVGLRPGTQVKLISSDGIKAVVQTREGVELTIAKAQLTNDLNEAALLVQHDAKTQQDLLSGKAPK